ncbi:MAG: hypothetical protein Q7K29_07630, partial [Thermoleophilia bacterium]|nr:hypothetical protein [Thermoleophilia bacterium]
WFKENGDTNICVPFFFPVFPSSSGKRKTLKNEGLSPGIRDEGGETGTRPSANHSTGAPQFLHPVKN